MFSLEFGLLKRQRLVQQWLICGVFYEIYLAALLTLPELRPTLMPPVHLWLGIGVSEKSADTPPCGFWVCPLLLVYLLKGKLRGAAQAVSAPTFMTIKGLDL